MNTKFIFTVTLIVLTTSARAQKGKSIQVPEVVKKAFESLKPEVKNPEWEMEGNDFEAEFKEAGKEVALIFHASGALFLTETEIPVAELPANTVSYIAKNASGKKIAEAAKLSYANGTVMFEAEAGNVDYIFDSGGNFVKVENEEEEDDGEEEEDN